jgi:hypothetical protein
MLITGVAQWLGGALLIALVVLVGLLFSPIDALEQFAWAGIGVAVLATRRVGYARATSASTNLFLESVLLSPT